VPLGRLLEQVLSTPVRVKLRQCGWCKNRWGLNWQVVPMGMGQFFTTSDAAAVDRWMRAKVTLKKLDASALEAAARG
jgi:predicted 3-demethylubiquinone-9 3-methyltransferase (glyoxalase superfamily)